MSPKPQNQAASAGMPAAVVDSVRRSPAIDFTIGALLFVLPLAVFLPEALGLRAYFHHDLQYYFYPYHKLVADIVAAGHLPLWNPYAFGGMPLIADGQTALFYPPNALFFLLPAEHALSLAVLLHYGIAGAGAYAYARQLRLAPMAAALAALSFMFNGFLVSRVVHYSIMAGAALVPLLFWAVDRLLLRPSRARFALAAAAIAVQTLAGHPQVPLYTAVALGLYCATIAVLRWRLRWRALVPLVLLAGTYVAGYALAAIQLLPWIEWAAYSPRAANASYEFVTFQSLRAFDWLLFLFPYGFGGLAENMMQTTPAWDLPVYLWERLGYVGLAPLALAVVGLGGWSTERGRNDETGKRGDREGTRQTVVGDDGSWRRERWTAIIVVLIGMLLIAAGNNTPAGYLVYLVPALGKLRAYSRAVAVAAFALSVLAGYGAHRLSQAGAHPRVLRSAIEAGVLVLASVGVTLWAANALGFDRLALWMPGLLAEPVWKNMLQRALQLGQANARVPLVLAMATAVLLCLAAFRPRSALLPLLLLTAADMVLFARAFNPTTDPKIFGRVPASVRFLRADNDVFRIASFIRDDRLPLQAAQSQLAVSWAIPYAIEDINGFNSLQTRRHLDMLLGPKEQDVSYGKLHNAGLLGSADPILNLFGVKYVLVQRQSDVRPPNQVDARSDPEAAPRWVQVFADEYVTIYRNREPLPRAFFAANVALEPNARRVLAAVSKPGFDPRRMSVVEGGLSPAQAVALAGTAPGSVAIERDGPNKLRLTTAAESARLLVLSEIWAPGWHAQIDGRPAPILRTNYLFRGIVVPAGRHEVRLVYRPSSLLWGAAISGLAALVIGGLFLTQSRATNKHRYHLISANKHQ